MSSVIKLYPNGLTAGVPPRTSAGGGKRGAVGGWSADSIRSNQRFLFSIDGAALAGLAYSFTLTLRDCPPSHKEWQALRNRWFKRLWRMDLLRLHWVTEWQIRMVPHLHGCAYFDSEGRATARRIIEAWLEVADEYRPAVQSQFVAQMYDTVGWFQYVSKHAARGLRHYQRSPDKIPPGWQGVTGRMWGAVGDWPRTDALALDMSMPGFHTFRRLLRRRRIADARAEGSARRIAQARRMLRCTDHKRSAVRGASDWCDLSESLMLVAAVRSLGHVVRS